MSDFRLLACFAHPDDEAIPVGGVLATHAARGVAVRLVTATLGEEGEIRQKGAATRESIGRVRREELFCSARALGLAEPVVLNYRDSGMQGTPPNRHPDAFINADARTVVEQLVRQVRSFRPQVLLTFEPGGLYGHPDHVAISRYATKAFHRAGDPSAFPQHLAEGLVPHRPLRLFYSARPQGYRTEMALKLRAVGVDFPLPTPERANDGSPAEEIHLSLDVSEQLETKMACIRCHLTQLAPDWPYNKVPRAVAADILGREYFIRGWPEVMPGEQVPEDFFDGISAGLSTNFHN
jgi:LmbE family N-acetylglucosaminyl deacetylase